MNVADAQRIIEELRLGIPPDGYIQHFTVGRQHEIEALERSLGEGRQPVLLLKANYGSGKSHLLRYIRELAHTLGYAVSLVTLDAKSGIRFNRMDQIMGAILRWIEVPPDRGPPGLRGALDFLCDQIELNPLKPYWEHLSNRSRWDYSAVLTSEAMFVALRAWNTGNEDAEELIIDWLQQPDTYRSQRKRLYRALVQDLRSDFRDPRSEWQFYHDGVFSFHTEGYRAAWDVLRDMDRLLRESGLKGLVILFDEFEDVLTNLNNIQWQETAFWNLFLFFSGSRFPGTSFYAVTPDFAMKCKVRLLMRKRFDFDYERFDKLPTFEMSPLTTSELQQLAERIQQTHSTAYNYECNGKQDELIRRSVQEASTSPVQDRARHTIKQVVHLLDDLLEGS